MMRIKFIVFILPVLLAACANAPMQTSADDDPEQRILDMSVVLPDMSDKNTGDNYPRMALSEKMLFTFLMADIAVQRGRTELAAKTFMELARKTRDARVARRAAQLSFEAREMDQAVEALQLWQEL